MKMQRGMVWLVLLGACGGQVSGEEGAGSQTPETSLESGSLATGLLRSGESLVAHEEDLLSVGSQGPQVERVYRYLHAYGYLPNPELEERYPGFQPLSPRSPARPDLYDAALAEAVSIFQANAGLESTGTVDHVTLDALTAPRSCQHPDGYHVPQERAGGPGSQDKFAVGNTNFTRTTWSIEGVLPAGVTKATVESVTQMMFNQWQTVHKNTFTKVSSGGQIQIRFDTQDGRATDNDGDGQCTHPQENPNTVDTGCEGGRGSSSTGVVLDNAEIWNFTGTTSTSTPYNQRAADYMTVLLHELGHVLGLLHSSDFNAVMYYKKTKGTMQRSLTADDRNAMRSQSAAFANLSPGFANPTDVHAFPQLVISSTPTPGGFTIHKNIAGTWQQIPGGATRISADSFQRPWVVNSFGQIFFRNRPNTEWTLVPGCATDIGVGNSGYVWVVGCDGALHYSNFSAAVDDPQLLATFANGWFRVGDNGANGIPALVNVSGNVNYCVAIDTNGALWGWTLAGWGKIDMPIHKPMVDVGGSRFEPGAIWASGAASNPGLFIYNFNAAVAGASHNPVLHQWLGYSTESARRVSVDTLGKPVFINGSGVLRSTTK